MVSVMDRLNNQSELCCQKENPQLGNSRPEMQLMERISARAEATLVLVGTQQIQANAKSDSDFMERMSNWIICTLPWKNNEKAQTKHSVLS